MSVELFSRQSGGGKMEQVEEGAWRLSLPQGPGGKYRWAQLDDYMHLRRGKFRWRSPFRMEVEGRVSGNQIPGTWGFGFWNDPFAMGVGAAGTRWRLPVLPNAAWFFFGAPPNHLALHNHAADGMLAATFRSPLIPPPFLGLGLPAVPFLLLRPAARLLRKMAGWIVKDEAVRLDLDLTEWRHYELDCWGHLARFLVDGRTVFETRVAPRGRLGFVLWIDNQWAAVRPNGTFGYGQLENPEPVWLEVRGIRVS